MNDYNVNVIISGPNNEHPATYKTFILRGNTSFADQVTEPNTKYVIKWDFNLNGEIVTVPENCILEFDGGTLKNGTIIGQDTFYSDDGGLGDDVIFGNGIIKKGTWRKNAGGNPDKPYDPTTHSGLGRKTLELKEGGSNILTQEDFSDANTIYVVQYDFDLDDGEIDVPDGCIIRFDGGSINNGTFRFNGATVEGEPKGTALYGVAYKDNSPLSHNYKRTRPLSQVYDHAFGTYGTCMLFDNGGNGYSCQSIQILDDYIIVFGLGNWDLADNCQPLLFDKNFNYLGKGNITGFGHCNDSTIVGDYIFAAYGSTAPIIAHAKISDIINSCLNGTTVTAVTQTMSDGFDTFYTVAYDPIQKLFATISRDLSTSSEIMHLSIWELNESTMQLTLKEKFNANLYEAMLRLLEKDGLYQYQGIYYNGTFANTTFKNGVVNALFWYHAGGDVAGVYRRDSEVSFLVEIDACTGLPVSNLGTIKQVGNKTECEGLCFDPDDDDEFWMINVGSFCNLSLGSDPTFVTSGAYIGRVSYTKEVSTSVLSGVIENHDSLMALGGDRFISVNNKYRGYSTGDSLHPFKDLGAAFFLARNIKNVTYGLEASEQEYAIGVLEVDCNMMIEAGTDPTTGKKAVISGKIHVLDGARLKLSNVIYKNNGGIDISLDRGKLVLYNGMEFVTNTGTISSATQGAIAVDANNGSEIYTHGTVKFTGYDTCVVLEHDSVIRRIGNISASYCNRVIQLYDVGVNCFGILSSISVDVNTPRKFTTPDSKTLPVLWEKIPTTVTTLEGLEEYAKGVMTDGDYINNSPIVLFKTNGIGEIPAGNYQIHPIYGLYLYGENKPDSADDSNNLLLGTSYLEIVDSSAIYTHENKKWRKVGSNPVPSAVDVTITQYPFVKKGIRFKAETQTICKEFVAPVKNGWYSFSFLAKGSGQLYIYIEMQIGDSSKQFGVTKTINSTEWTIVSYTFLSDNVKLSGVHGAKIRMANAGDVTIAAAKMEANSRSTGWVANPKEYPKGGTTTERPLGIDVGYQYFDTTLNKTIVYNGTAWVNIDGTPLT